MIKISISVGLVPILAMSLLPIAGQAEIVNNEIGLYTDISGDPATTSITIEPYELFDVHLVLTNPFNEEFTPEDCGDPIRREINFIFGYQYRLLKPAIGMYTMAMIPNGFVDVSASNEFDQVVGFLDPIAVPESRAVVLVTYTFMVLDMDPKFFYLEPTVEGPSDFLGVYDAEEYVPPIGCDWSSIQHAYPISGSFSNPVFAINSSVVSTENASWGVVKALYR